MSHFCPQEKCRKKNARDYPFPRKSYHLPGPFQDAGRPMLFGRRKHISSWCGRAQQHVRLLHDAMNQPSPPFPDWLSGRPTLLGVTSTSLADAGRRGSEINVTACHTAITVTSDSTYSSAEYTSMQRQPGGRPGGRIDSAMGSRW